MARKTKQEAEETRERILKAALSIIYEKGYARSTFVDIAKRIQLTKGAVYWHFSSKSEMFLALGRQMDERIDLMLNTMYENTETLNDLKEMLIEMTLLIAEDEPLNKYYTIVYYRMEWTQELLPVKQFCDDQDETMTTWIEELLERARAAHEIPEKSNVRHLAVALYSLVNGLIAHCLYEDETNRGTRAEIVRTGLDIFFSGMMVQKDSSK